MERKEIEEVEEVKGFGWGDAGGSRTRDTQSGRLSPFAEGGPSPLPGFFISVHSKGS